MSSDAISMLILTEVGNTLCHNSPVAELCPEAANPGGFAVSGGDVRSIFGGTGRPIGEESDRRRKEFARLVASGIPFDEAADRSRITYKRALRILFEPEMRNVIAIAA